VTQITRRAVLAGTGAAVGACCLAACGGNAATAGAAPTSTGASSGAGNPAASGSGATLGTVPLTDVPVGGAKLEMLGGRAVILTQPVAGQPAVFLNRCTHAGCQLAVSGTQLVCPCHGSTFDFTGQVVNGPATDPLQEGSLRVDSGQIVVESV
jgi:cytochrome b6-f complex iron-sulfur subunit